MKVKLNLSNFNNDFQSDSEISNLNSISDSLIPIGKSGIHIKKKNRGKFTEYCGGKVTDACIRKAKASGNPKLVKRATFAANARKWKHQAGGKVIDIAGAKRQLGETPWIRHETFEEYDSLGRPLYNRFDSFYGDDIEQMQGGIIKAEDGTNLTEEQKKISWGKQVYPEIVSALDSIGVDREYAPYVFAMSANESGWGQKPSGQNNYFGMKAGKNQKGTVVTTHEGYGNNRVKIKDKFLDYSSLSDSINQAVRRLNDKFHAFSVPVEQFAMNLYQNRYYTNSPANYHDAVNGVVNGKLIKKVLNETKLPDRRIPLVQDWNSIPRWKQ